MTKVKMKIGIKLDGKPVAIGDTVDVSDSVAKRWIAQKIAESADPAKAGGEDLSTQDTQPSATPTSTSAKK